MSSQVQILVLQPKRIGDLILTAPAVAALRGAYPDSHITLVSAGASGGIAELIGADECLNYRYGRPNLQIWTRLATSGFDICVDFGGTDRSALMAKVSRASVKATYEKFVDGRRRARAYTQLCGASVRDLHTVDFHLALVEEISGEATDGSDSGKDGFLIPNSLADRARDLVDTRSTEPGARYAIIHPGTARPEKYWLPERWAEVIQRISDRGLVPVITGSDDPAERGHLGRIHDRLDCPVVDLAGQISLTELAALIDACDLAVGVDTAAMHLAAVSRRPQVVLFGPTNPFHWRPRHSDAAVLVASDSDTPTTEFVPRHKKAPMSHISTDAVTHAIDGLLRKD